MDETNTPSLPRLLDPGLFKALSDSTRLTLLARLASASQPLTVTEASSCCGVHLSGVSRHLKILRDAGLLDVEKNGREVMYRLRTKMLISTLRDLADALESCSPACCETEGCEAEDCSDETSCETSPCVFVPEIEPTDLKD